MRAQEIRARQRANRGSNPSESELQVLKDGIDGFVGRNAQYATTNFVLGSFRLGGANAGIAYKPSESRFGIWGKPADTDVLLQPEAYTTLADAYDRVEEIIPALNDMNFETSPD